MTATTKRWPAILVACFLLLGGLATGALAAPAGQSAAMVQVASNAQHGNILVNSAGMTLYTLSSEAGGAIKCTGTCLGAWPPLLLPAGTTSPTVGAGVTGTIGTITRPEGTVQVTYNGFPLYTFSGDTAAGQTSGDGIAAFGGTWHVVQVAAAGTTPSPSATPVPTATSVPSAPIVQIGASALGSVLVNSQGRTLYYNTADSTTKFVCSGGCLGVWPPLLLPAGVTTPTTGPGVPASVGTAVRPEGGVQVTYAGFPLYTFAKDTKPGDTTGEGIVALGGTWHAALVNSIPLAAAPAVRLTLHVTTTGRTVWGTIRVAYTFGGRHLKASCASRTCRLTVPAGVALHLRQRPTNAVTWPFRSWKIASGHARRLLRTVRTTLTIRRNTTVTAVYVVG